MRMIHVNANTAEEIGMMLRGEGEEYNRHFKAHQMAWALLGKDVDKSILITAPRRSGKTTELLKFAKERHPHGEFIIICPNMQMKQMIIQMYHEMFDKVGSRFIYRNLPVIVYLSVINEVRGYNYPIYIDDWNSIGELEDISRAGLWNNFVAAVTS